MIAENISEIKQEIGQNVDLIIVSKYRSAEEILSAYNSGHRLFAENRVQALLERQSVLPKDIRWHLIGHLQTNKVKYIAPFIQCIQSVDSLKLLTIIDEEARKNQRVIDCLLQMHIAQEETKFGLNRDECLHILNTLKSGAFKFVRVRGLMGMASNTSDLNQVENEFKGLKLLFDEFKKDFEWDTLSMGMSSDYRIAVKFGSTMVRIGSKIFE